MASTIPSPCHADKFQFPNWARFGCPSLDRQNRAVRQSQLLSSLASSLPWISARPKPNSAHLYSPRAALSEDDRRLGRHHPPLREQLVVTFVPLARLLGAVAFVLLIACANVASCPRKTLARRKEIAIRPARARAYRSAPDPVRTVLLSVAGGRLSLLARFGVT